MNFIHTNSTDYEKIRKIGEGSFGEVYLVKNIKSGKNYVSKDIKIEGMSEDVTIQMFREAKILEALDHPNIVKLFEFYKTRSKKLVLILEYAQGGDLSELIKEKLNDKKKNISKKINEKHKVNNNEENNNKNIQNNFFSEKKIIKWIIQLLLSIKYSHDHKIIHRDIKSANIFLDFENNIKLGDFGLAKNLRNSQHMLNDFMGTPLYLSPEIIENKSYSFKTDIWSLGIIFFEMMNLNHPFKSKNFGELIDKIKNKKLPVLNNFYSEDLRNFVKGLLIMKVEDRPDINDLLENDFILKNLFFNKNEFKTLIRMNKKNTLKISEVDLLNDLKSLKTYRFSQYKNTNQILKEIQKNEQIKKSKFCNNTSEKNFEESVIQEEFLKSKKDLGNFFEEMCKKKNKNNENKFKDSLLLKNNENNFEDSLLLKNEIKNFGDSCSILINGKHIEDESLLINNNIKKFKEEDSFFNKDNSVIKKNDFFKNEENFEKDNSYFKNEEDKNSFFDNNKKSICNKNDFFTKGENFEEENSFFDNEKSVYDKIDESVLEEKNIIKNIKNKKSKFFKKEEEFFSSELEDIEFKEEKNSSEKKENFLFINDVELDSKNENFLQTDIIQINFKEKEESFILGKKTEKKKKKDFGLITTKLKSILDLEKKKKKDKSLKKTEKKIINLSIEKKKKIEEDNFEFYNSDYSINLNYSQTIRNSKIEEEKKVSKNSRVFKEMESYLFESNIKNECSIFPEYKNLNKEKKIFKLKSNNFFKLNISKKKDVKKLYKKKEKNFDKNKTNENKNEFLIEKKTRFKIDKKMVNKNIKKIIEKNKERESINHSALNKNFLSKLKNKNFFKPQKKNISLQIRKKYRKSQISNIQKKKNLLLNKFGNKFNLLYSSSKKYILFNGYENSVKLIKKNREDFLSGFNEVSEISYKGFIKNKYIVELLKLTILEMRNGSII